MKKYLKRSYLSNLIADIGFDNINEVIERIKLLFFTYDFKSDKNYVLTGRREFIIKECQDLLDNKLERFKDSSLDSDLKKASFLISNLYEFSNCSAHPYYSMDETNNDLINASITQARAFDNIYMENDIVSLEEKNVIEDIINKIDLMYNKGEVVNFRDATIISLKIDKSNHYIILESVSNDTNANLYYINLDENMEINDDYKVKIEKDTLGQYKTIFNGYLPIWAISIDIFKPAGFNVEWELKRVVKGSEYKINGNGYVPVEWNTFLNKIAIIENEFRNRDKQGIKFSSVNRGEKVVTKEEIIINDTYKNEEPKPINTNFDNLKRKIESSMPDPFFASTFVDYFIDNYRDSAEAEKDYDDIAKYDDIFNDFSKYVVQNSFNYPNQIEIEGYSPKKLHEIMPKMSGSEIYSLLKMLRDDKEHALEIINGYDGEL